ncbi:hypothetical protein CTAYLR_004975 [Chrysophaeum taylorii]|uniref:Uncharacterized protein n=1 Tax=Chrysophaeum taylorii TaxID=2483200 RepID=A0AAD7UR28_9STRA|nr:hypothetical protein CTAYLR_004975 [Chrysophaeum taylorii]
MRGGQPMRCLPAMMHPVNVHRGRLPLAMRGGSMVDAATAYLRAPDGLVGLKIGLAVTLCAFNAACWGVPLRFRNFASSAKALSVASTFSGGVFLALAFGHMMPEAAQAFAATAVEPMRLACIWTLAGYLLIWAVERASTVANGNDGYHRQHGGASAAILLGALSVHSILETMALAVARTKIAALLLAASIALHQPAESVALLVALLRAGLKGSKLLKLLLTFTAMGPLGSLTGLLLHDKFAATRTGALLDGALVSLTAGTFIFVGATEVIPEEFAEEERPSKLKTAALAAGVSVMLLIANLADKLEQYA